MTFLRTVLCLGYLSTGLFPISARDLEYDDILIVEIRAKDLGLKIKSDAAYQKNVAQRSMFRKALADFISEANTRAGFILVDAWFPDLFNNDSEKALLEALRSRPNITIGGGSRPDKEYTHPVFKATVPRVGHVLYYGDDPKTVTFFNVYCSDWENPVRSIANCPPDKKEPDIALIALEGFLGEKLSYPEDGFLEIPRNLIMEFPRISYTEFKKNPAIVADKLVIVVNKSTPSADMHKLIKGKKISGSELIATSIFAYYYTLKKK